LIDSVIAQGFTGRVRTQVAHDLPILVLDEMRVRLLLRNLLGNAVRYAGATPPTLRAVVSGDTLCIEVEDKGAGIAPEHIERLTDPFYRVDPSRTRATGGFGLGLYLCRLICEAHGGELKITSTLGVGTTVTATLHSQ
jgi:signal transduction histidine kinase